LPRKLLLSTGRRLPPTPAGVRAGVVCPVRRWGRIVECTRWGHQVTWGADGTAPTGRTAGPWMSRPGFDRPPQRRGPGAGPCWRLRRPRVGRAVQSRGGEEPGRRAGCQEVRANLDGSGFAKVTDDELDHIAWCREGATAIAAVDPAPRSPERWLAECRRRPDSRVARRRLCPRRRSTVS
jgi:hypothetical protein